MKIEVLRISVKYLRHGTTFSDHGRSKFVASQLTRSVKTPSQLPKTPVGSGCGGGTGACQSRAPVPLVRDYIGGTVPLTPTATSTAFTGVPGLATTNTCAPFTSALLSAG